MMFVKSFENKEKSKIQKRIYQLEDEYNYNFFVDKKNIGYFTVYIDGFSNSMTNVNFVKKILVQ